MLLFFKSMSSRKVINKYENVYFHSSKKSGYFPTKQNVTEYGDVYSFREVGWHKGLPVDVDLNTRKINTNVDGTFQIFSLTKNAIDWNERKIIHKIDITLKKNIVEEFDECLQFGIVRVKKGIFNANSSNKLRDRTRFWSEDKHQLITGVENAMFSKSVVLDNLNYDLSADDDLVLFQQVGFFGLNHKSTPGNKKFAYATKPFSIYDITIVYSIGTI